MSNSKIYKHQTGFTLIELIVVVLVIGVISTMTMLSYQGIQGKARDTSILSDLDAMDGLQTSYGLKNKTSGLDYYSGTGSSSQLGFTPSSGNVIDVVTNDTDYCIRGYNQNSNKKTIWDAYTKESSPGVCAALPPSEAAGGFSVVTIGLQTWMAKNLNEGDMIDSSVSQVYNNSIKEKYCYEDNIAYCNSHGGLYDTNEAAQAIMSDSIRGLCPVNFHIPTDAEFQQLETELGMTNPDSTGWRNAPGIANQLVTGAFKAKIGGFFWGANSWDYVDFTGGYLTSSVAYLGNVYVRVFDGPNSNLFGRFEGTMMMGGVGSIRCIMN